MSQFFGIVCEQPAFDGFLQEFWKECECQAEAYGAPWCGELHYVDGPQKCAECIVKGIDNKIDDERDYTPVQQ